MQVSHDDFHLCLRSHSHPLILGTNWPGFQAFVREMFVDRPAGARHGVEYTGEAMLGWLLTSAPCEGSASPPFAAILLGDFPSGQLHEETLRHGFDQVRVIDGQ